MGMPRDHTGFGALNVLTVAIRCAGRVTLSYQSAGLECPIFSEVQELLSTNRDTSPWRQDLPGNVRAWGRSLAPDLAFTVLSGPGGLRVGPAYGRALGRLLDARWAVVSDARAASGFREAGAWLVQSVADVSRIRRASRRSAVGSSLSPLAEVALAELLNNSLTYGTAGIRVAWGEIGGRPAFELRDERSSLDLPQILARYLHPRPTRQDSRMHRGYWVVLDAAFELWSQAGPPAVTIVTFPSPNCVKETSSRVDS